MPTEDRATKRVTQIATIRAFIIKNAGGPVDTEHLKSLERLTDKALPLLAAAAETALKNLQQ